MRQTIFILCIGLVIEVTDAGVEPHHDKASEEA